ncbi:MAG: class I SAM-dependent methyltransferase [Clostridiales bacterium]|nr:class I SAM-dependent methyltransferase [Clostridiales bacterium]
MEKMEEHFNKEAEKHDSFFINELGLKEFYDEVEVQLNKSKIKSNILVLGCGSGLEIERIKFKANVKAVDISENMIKKLNEKTLYHEVALETVCASFLELEFETEKYDLVLSCYAMHHFNEEQKQKLYTSIFNSLKKNGVFINGDSMALNYEEEYERYEKAKKIYDEKNLPFASLHIDVHFCYEHEQDTLRRAGFNQVILEREWNKTKLYRAIKV